MGLNVLVVDDSPTFQRYLKRGLSAMGEVSSVTLAFSGEEAEEIIRISGDHFHLVTMDIEMPGMGGIQACQRIKALRQLAIIVISSVWSPSELALTFRALEMGADDIMAKPGPGTTPEAFAKEVLRRALPIINRIPHAAPPKPSPEVPPPSMVERTPHPIEAVAIGASTGGPKSTLELLKSIPSPCPVPILLVQHMFKGFEEGYARWLGDGSGHVISIASRGERLSGGKVFLCPSGLHMKVRNGSVDLSEEPPEHGVRPAVSVLFRSMLKEYGPRWAAVLLSGMGTDGSLEMAEARGAGAFTMAQDQASSVVWGMPGEAYMLGGVTLLAPPAELGSRLASLVTKTERKVGE